jgi:putative molybdopterin biosynthesis protein
MDNHLNLVSLRNLEALKLLGEPRRLAIMQNLMLRPATLSQLGRALDIHPAQVRHHVKRLEAEGLVEFAYTRVHGSFIEKYYRASANAYQVNLLIVPDYQGRSTLIAMGSDDPSLGLLAEDLSESSENPYLINIPVGSLDGLIALRQGLCQLAGSHLWDPDSEDYNISYLQKIFPDRVVRAFTMSERVQGMLVREGNPKNITAADDLIRPGITFINRKAGSGTRLWIESWVREQQIPVDRIIGFDHEAITHQEVATAVASKQADVGIGIAAVASMPGIEFYPLFQERFDLVIAAEYVADPRMTRLIEQLQSRALRENILALDGYSTTQTGVELSVTPTTGGGNA